MRLLKLGIELFRLIAGCQSPVQPLLLQLLLGKLAGTALDLRRQSVLGQVPRSNSFGNCPRCSAIRSSSHWQPT